MPFEFIDNNSIDSAARKRIRSHAALGKNAGRTLARSSRKKAQAPRVMTATTLIRIPKTVQDAFLADRNEDAVPEIERQVADGVCFPVQLASESRRLAQRVFHFLSGPRFAPELNNAIDCTGTSVSIWVQYMLVDEAYFHCTIALSISAMNNLLCEKEDATDAMRHLSRTFRIINERLTGNRAVSDETIAAVVGMAQYDRHQGEYSRGCIHIQGLRRMVALRGGITKLASDRPTLTQKIFRIDLEYALQLGAEPIFTSADVEIGSRKMFSRNSFKRPKDKDAVNDCEAKLSRHFGDALWDLLLDVRHAASLINDCGASRRPKLNSFEFHDRLIRFGYQLLAINTLGGSRISNALENFIHLGLAAFMMTFLRGLDRLIAENPLLSELARKAGQSYCGQDSEEQQTFLWFVLIGRSSIFREQDEEWLLPKMRQTTEALGLHTWEDVREIVSIFPWVNSLHNKAGEELWRRCRENGSSDPQG
ncbi:hypothetical protein B0T10DRAFT_130463 [Thelonectria olida]|uniref:Tachykinin family protein n=1 Tax=Thelonectria olida TaxID=1576542 RepID=A0A9P8VYK0_9HYPO|nr:hypothetical protein B0T10DRAFT_130463 [Thelonectria olida]